MDIKELDAKLKEFLEIYQHETQSYIFNLGNDEKLSKADYEDLARQTFYLFYEFKDNIIKYLESQEK